MSDDKQHEEMVAYRRFKEAVDAKSTAERRVRELEAELASAKATAGVSEGLAASNAELKQQIKDMQSTHSLDMAFATSGVSSLSDPEVRGLFTQRFQAQTKDGEKDPGKWLESLQSNVKDNPDNVPLVLRSFLGEAASPAAPSSPGGALPSEPRGGRPPGAAPMFTNEQVAAMSPQEVAANLPAIAAANPGAGIPTHLPWAPQPTADNK